MADVETIAEDLHRQKRSTLNPEVSKDDIVNAWKYVADYIQRQMLQTKGVNVAGLGIFTFSQKKLDIGNNKCLVIQRPIFVLSEKFAQQHQLSCTKYYVTGTIPVRDLNYAAICMESPFNRDTIEACVKAVLQEFSRALAQGRNIEFGLSGVGRLTIRGGKVKMKFFKEFINSFDDSGHLLDALKDRPDTADSVMSRCPTRAQTANTMILPSLVDPTNSKASRPPLVDTIKEVEGDVDPFLMEAERKEKDRKEAQVHGEAQVVGVEPDLQQVLDDLDDKMAQARKKLKNQGIPAASKEGPANEDEQRERTQDQEAEQALKAAGLPESLQDKHKDDLAPLSGRASRKLAPVAQVGGVNFDEMAATAQRLTPIQASPFPGQRVGYQSPADKPGMHSPIAGAGLSLPGTPLVQPMGGSLDPSALRPLSKPGTACGHNAGQELCYLCHQRSAKNIPVSFDEERRLREMEEDNLLAQYQLMKNNETLITEQEKDRARRFENQKVSAFNLGVAEAVKDKQKEKPGPSNAYIFKKRPLTPPKYVKHNQLAGFLSQQVNDKTNQHNKEKTEKEFLERLEQVQLAEDLASQRERYIQDRVDEKNRYRAALSTQLKYKPLPIPGLQADREVFGKNDTTVTDLLERKRMAQQVARDQLGSVADKKRAEILRRVQDQKEEESILKKNKEELLSDRARRHERSMRNRKSLESDWLQSVEQKKTKDLEDRLRTITPGGLLHEQCDQYKRCAQCKKKLGNIGESNIWRESRYIPGARVMV